MIKAAIFDVDGTLIDSLGGRRTAVSGYLGSVGVPFDEDVYKRMHRLTAELIGSSPSETVVFEDSPHAADTARKAGFQVELVSGDLTDCAARAAILRRAGVKL